MKRLFVFLLIAKFLCAQCTIATGSQSGCPGSLTTGTVSGSPSVKCTAAATYSTMGNTGARTWSYCYLVADSPSLLTGPICVWIHGGGDNMGDSLGDFTWAANGPVNLVFPIQFDHLGTCRSTVSLNYTMYAGGGGTNAPYPSAGAPIQDILCGLHAIANKAGTLFPGNPLDMRGAAFSWGGQLLPIALWNAAGYTSVCEFSDAYNVRGMSLLSPVPAVASQWTGTFNAGAGSPYYGVDSTYSPSIAGAFSCSASSATACPAAAAPYDAITYWASGKTRIFLYVDGVNDTITNPTWQGNVLQTAMGGAMNYWLEPGASSGHGALCHSTSAIMSEPCYYLLLQSLSDNSRSAAGGGSLAAGGTF